MAYDSDLDLVEVSPNANPPVCHIMDYGKYKFKQQKRNKENNNNKNQHNKVIKEIKMRPKIGEHDYQFKLKAIKNFIADNYKVKISIIFKGREISFIDIGKSLMQRLLTEISDISKTDTKPILDGSNLYIIISSKLK
jgi:translation initiation factor IF-3